VPRGKKCCNFDSFALRQALPRPQESSSLSAWKRRASVVCMRSQQRVSYKIFSFMTKSRSPQSNRIWLAGGMWAHVGARGRTRATSCFMHYLFYRQAYELPFVSHSQTKLCHSHSPRLTSGTMNLTSLYQFYETFLWGLLFGPVVLGPG
jgi:hypothetical protein